MHRARVDWGWDRRRALVVGVILYGTSLAYGDEAPAKAPAPDVSIEGYCPVSYQSQDKAVKGDPAFPVEYQGFVYHCADAAAKKLFEADPKKYAPQYGGLCTTALGGSYGNRVLSDPVVYYVIDGKLYLFSSLRARKAFDRWPNQYIEKANGLYEKPALNGYCIVSYLASGKAVKGESKFARSYRGAVYHFATDDAARSFDQNRERFLPQFEGMCAEGMARGKSYSADPKLFEVIDGKTYLFFDEAAKRSFLADAKNLITKADKEWAVFVVTRDKELKDQLAAFRTMTPDGRPRQDASPASPPSEPAPSKP